MKKGIIVLVAVFLTIGGVAFASEGGSSHGGEGLPKAAIQSAMLKYIDRKTCAKGTICQLGDITAEYDYLHGGVKQKDGYYISCVDFRAGNDVYDVDYYVKEKNGTFVVEKEVLHKKNGEPVNKVLWSKEEHKGSQHEHREQKGSQR